MIRILLLCFIPSLWTVHQGAAQAALSVTPAYAVVTDQQPYGTFALKNQGTESVEITIHARFGVIASTDSMTAVVLGEAGHLGDLSTQLIFFPDRCILPPGGEQIVRYRIQEAPQGGHITLMHFAMQERGAIVEGQIPAVASGLSIVYNLVAPLVYLQGTGVPELSAKVVGSSPKEMQVYLENHSPWPFFGGIRVLQDGVQLGRSESAIYTSRRIYIPVSTLPAHGSISLEFDSKYTGLPRAVAQGLGVPPAIQLKFD